MSMSSGSRDYGRFDQLAEEFAERFRRGERPSLQEYVDRLPEMADEIREMFPALVEVERAEGDARGDGAATSAAAPPAAPRLSEIGDYRILREVGRGGMGVVYEAEQVSLGRRVALKVLPVHVVGDRKALERFRREAKAAAKLHHTNIVPVFDIGREGDYAYYAMQLIQGQGLDQVIDELRWLREPGRKAQAQGEASLDSPQATANMSGAEVGALASLRRHQQGRMAELLLSGRFVTEGLELEPSEGAGFTETGLARTERFDLDATSDSNAPAVTLGDHPLAQAAVASEATGSALLPGGAHVSELDTSGHGLPFFRSVAQIGRQAAQGLAHAHARGIVHRDIKPSNLLLDTDGVLWITDFGLAKAEDDGLTATGDILGTLRYMAPERFRGEGDARADIYALGMTLYELLTLRPAYDSSDRLKLIEQIKTEEPTRPRLIESRIPRDLETIVLKAIVKDPERRYPTSDAMAEDLRRFLADEPIQARRASPVERYWRWARRNPTIAVLGGVLTALLIAITVASVVAAAHFRDLERQERGLVQVKVALAERNRRLAEENEAAKQRAEEAQSQAVTTLVDMHTSRGLLAGERDDPARAVLWFAEAAEESASHPERQASNHLRARNWARDLTAPVRAFSLPMSVGVGVRVLEFQPRGELLLVVTGDRLHVRDWRGEEFLPWADGVSKVGAACWSPDGRNLAIGHHSGSLEIRSAPEGEVLHEVRLPGAITALVFSPDGQYLAVAWSVVEDWKKSATVIPWDLPREQEGPRVRGTVVQLWDARSHTLLPCEWEHPEPVHSLVFDRAGKRLITASLDMKARAFAVPGDPDRPAPLFQGVPHEPRYSSPPAFIKDDSALVTISKYSETSKTELSTWDAGTGKPASPGIALANPTYAPRVIASPRGDWFATSGHFGPEVWQSGDPSAKSIYLGDHTHYVEDLAASPDGKSLLSVSWDQTARLYSVPDGKPLGSPLPHMGMVTRAAFSGDGKQIATVSEGMVRIWRRPAGETAGIQAVHWGGIVRPSFDGRWIAPGIWHEGALPFMPINLGILVVLSASTGAAAGPTITLPGDLVDSCICADNQSVAVVSTENGRGWLSLHDVTSGRALWKPVQLPGEPRSVAARPSAPQAAVLCAGGELLVFDIRTGEGVLDLAPEGRRAPWRTSRVEYSGDGGTLVCQTQGGGEVIQVRDAATGELRYPPIRPVLQDGPLRSFALSDDGRLLATAVNGKNAAQVWDLATGRALSEPLPHPGDYYGIFCIRFSPDGQRLLTGSKDRQARLWDWKTATLACPPLKHEEEVFALAMTPDGRFAFSGGRDRASSIHIWDLTTGKLAAPKIPVPKNVESMIWTPAGPRVVAVCGGNVALLETARVLAPPVMPIEDYLLLGELASGQRIEQGDESGLTSEEWLKRLALFNERHPDYGDSGAAGAKSPAKTDPDQYEQARRLLNSGIAAFRGGRFADATADLQKASEQLKALRRSRPNDPLLARGHGLSLGFLASSLRELKRRGEALAFARESLAVYEAMKDPDPGDLYNLACGCALVSDLHDEGARGEREKLEARAVGYLRRAIEGDPAKVLPQAARDRDLDSLRGRADFRELMADAGFPRDVFAGPSPLAVFSKPGPMKDELDRLSAEISGRPADFASWVARGDFLARHGEWAAALLDYRKALDLHPPAAWTGTWDETSFGIRAAVVLLQAEDLDGYRRFARAMLDRFDGSNDPMVAERTAKINSLIPAPEEDLKRVTELAERAVRLGQADEFLPFYQLACGMACCRTGEFTKAVEWLERPEANSLDGPYLATIRCYLAMAQHRVGNTDQARSLLEKASQELGPVTGEKDLGGAWADLMIAEMARREAEAALGQGQSQVDSPSPAADTPARER